MTSRRRAKGWPFSISRGLEGSHIMSEWRLVIRSDDADEDDDEEDDDDNNDDSEKIIMTIVVIILTITLVMSLLTHFH